jgi:hypothetical protein
VADWKKLGGNALVTAIVAGLFLSAFNIFYNQIYNIPKFNIDVSPNAQNGLAEINVINEGIPATHVVLTIQTPEKIIKYHIFTTENLTNVNSSDQKTLKIYLPRLERGGGSIIKIDTLVTSKTKVQYPNYTIWATYDQGSFKYVLQKPLSSEEEFIVFWSQYKIPIILICIGIAVVLLKRYWTTLILSLIFLGFVIYFEILILYGRVRGDEFLSIFGKDIGMSVKSGIRSMVVRYTFRFRASGSDITLELITVRTALKNDIRSRDIFSESWGAEEFGNNSRWRKKAYDERRSLIQNPRDYVVIDDFYARLNKRNDYIKKSQINGVELINHNQECLVLAETALSEIDWTKYR